MSCADAGTKPVRRIDVFTGAGQRRDWSDEEKAAIVAESYSGLESACAVAQRHGLSHAQLFTWRRKLREMGLAKSDATPTEPAFVPAIVEPSIIEKKPRTKRKRSRSFGKAIPAIELEIDGVSVRIAKGADARTIAAVIDALKGGA
ncbi:transposase [Fulvimarina manganoxydans]|uniref:Transposase n=2 Tax=Fulvimarina manganoxydans TaxID=937218 RepID=A0A1W2EVE0_9HYPH|nr:transposase [Fulvimarina manganoxydans]